MSDPFEDLHSALMEEFGVAATLRGQPVRVSLEHGVAISGEMGEVVAYRSVATFRQDAAPRSGDALVVGDKTYHIDTQDEANGYVSRWILR